MADLATTVDSLPSRGSMLDRKLTKSPSRWGVVLFLLALAGGLWYIGFSRCPGLGLGDHHQHLALSAAGLALVIALGFESSTASTILQMPLPQSFTPILWNRPLPLSCLAFAT